MGYLEDSGVGKFVVVTADHSLDGPCGGLVSLGVDVDAVGVAGTEGQRQKHLQDACLGWKVIYGTPYTKKKKLSKKKILCNV